MQRWFTVMGLLLGMHGGMVTAEKSTEYLNNWPQWRGPLASGVSPAGNPPGEWGETKNVMWKIAVPGKGHSTPVIWCNQVFILTAVETDKEEVAGQTNAEAAPARPGMPVTRTNKICKFVVMSLNRQDGKVLWQHTVKEEHPEDGLHPDFGSWASNSPVTDGEHVYAYFGSRGLYCFDMKGNL